MLIHPTLDLLTSLLHQHRQAHDARPHQRAGTARTQAKLVLRWLRDGTRVADLARDHHLSQATGYRYLDAASFRVPSRTSKSCVVISDDSSPRRSTRSPSNESRTSF